jgi:AraC-like DNA-binding protein
LGSIVIKLSIFALPTEERSEVKKVFLSLSERSMEGDMATDINYVKSYILEHLLELKTLKEVAAKLNISAETLRKDFLRKENTLISEFITNQRIAKMKYLLETTELRCFEICFMFGLREDSGETTFKRVVGMSMESYRRFSHRRSPSDLTPSGQSSMSMTYSYSTPLRQEIKIPTNGNGRNGHSNKNGALSL